MNLFFKGKTPEFPQQKLHATLNIKCKNLTSMSPIIPQLLSVSVHFYQSTKMQFHQNKKRKK